MIFYVFNFLKSNFWKVWKINLSQFWIPYGLNNHKVSPGSMTKRVVSHFDYNTITFNVKCDQIIVSWTYLTHLGGNQTPLNIITVKEVIWNHNFFLSILRSSVSQTCRIMCLYMRKPNLKVTGTIQLCLSYYFVTELLVGHLIELPVCIIDLKHILCA